MSHCVALREAAAQTQTRDFSMARLSENWKDMTADRLKQW